MNVMQALVLSIVTASNHIEEHADYKKEERRLEKGTIEVPRNLTPKTGFPISHDQAEKQINRVIFNISRLISTIY